MATKKNPEKEEIVEQEVPVEAKVEKEPTPKKKAAPKAEVKEEKEVVVPKKKSQKMIVGNCEQLFVRATPSKNGFIKGVINKGDVVTVNFEESTDEFYNIHTPFIHGYCMRDYLI